MKIIIDTDPRHDDALALMLACKSLQFEVLAITTVAGNSTIENTTRNARFILAFIGRNDIPVYSGAVHPIKRPAVQAVVHGKNGLEGLEPQNEACLTGDTVDQILRLVRENPNEITIITLAPLTNIAEAIRRDPDTMSQVMQIVSMGGAISVAGNMNKFSEFNFFVDPDAVSIMLRFEKVPKILVPLDVCNLVLMNFNEFKQIQDVPLRDLILKMMHSYITNLHHNIGADTALMYDPLTVFFLLQPQSCQTTCYKVRVETKDEITRGMTIGDRCINQDHKDNDISIVTAINSSDFIKRFISTLSGKKN